LHASIPAMENDRSLYSACLKRRRGRQACMMPRSRAAGSRGQARSSGSSAIEMGTTAVGKSFSAAACIACIACSSNGRASE
jgi:hypothetical protein